MEIRKQQEKEWEKGLWPLTVENLYDDGVNFWFTEYTFNGLFQMDKKEHIPRLIGEFPGEDFSRERLYTSTAMCNRKLYFAPFFAREIGAFDLKTGKFEKIPIPVPKKEDSWDWNREKFFRAVAVENRVYFLPCHYPGILCYDTETGTFDLFDQWVDEVERMRVSEWWYFLDYELSNNIIYLPCSCADGVVMLDIAQKKTWVLKTFGGDFPCRFCGICQKEGDFYLLRGDGVVAVHHLKAEGEDEDVIRLPVKGEDREQQISFYPMCHAGNYLYFFPFLEGECFCLNMENFCIESVCGFDEEQSLEGIDFLFLTALWDGKALYAMGGRSRRFLEYRREQGEIILSGLFLREEERKLLMTRKKEDFLSRSRQRELYENNWDSLGLLLSALEHGENVSNLFWEKRTNMDYVRYGEKIYHTLICQAF